MSSGTEPALPPIHIAHVLYGFTIGGLENGMVNLINRLDPARYHHSIVSLQQHNPEFAKRLNGSNYALYDLGKREGNDPRLWINMFRLLRRLRPDIVHTRNFVALEMQLVALCAGVRRRVHGEHGWDVHDLDGSNVKHQWVRRVLAPTVHRFVALSRQIEHYLVDIVGVPARKVERICNGVDDERFQCAPREFRQPLVIGTVGRMKEVKNQPALCRGFIELVRRRPELRSRVHLRLVGTGPLQSACEQLALQSGMSDLIECAGDSATVADDLRAMDVFVLPSRSEGISNTILEAMASALPVIATAVGGNGELVADGESGFLVPVDDDAALAAALERYVDDANLCLRHGAAGRARVDREFSLNQMVSTYDKLYRRLAA